MIKIIMGLTHHLNREVFWIDEAEIASVEKMRMNNNALRSVVYISLRNGRVITLGKGDYDCREAEMFMKAWERLMEDKNKSLGGDYIIEVGNPLEKSNG